MRLRVRDVVCFVLVLVIIVSGCGSTGGSDGERDRSARSSSGGKYRVVRDDHFMIQGVKVRDHQDRLVEAIGLPDQKQVEEDMTAYTYGDVQFYIQGKRIFYISSTDPEYATARGVRVGDTFSAVYERYEDYELRGVVDRYNSVKVIKYVLIPGKDYTVELEFEYDADEPEPKVRSISMLPTAFEEEWLATSILITSEDGWRVDSSGSRKGEREKK